MLQKFPSQTLGGANVKKNRKPCQKEKLNVFHFSYSSYQIVEADDLS
ncbi:hypothetical protein [Legionella genomosp. 1]|nr:hypothetical protein [Legionella genomosp. 1]